MQDRLPGEGTIALYRYSEKTDFDHYLALTKPPETRRFLDPVHSHNSVVEELQFLHRSADDLHTMIYTIVRESDHTHVGSVMLTSIDAGYHHRAKVSRLIIAPSERGKGIAQEALRSLSRFAFRHLRLRFLYCYVFETNVHGRKLFSKFGFEEYGRRPEWSWDGTNYVDEFEMRLTAERFHEIYRSGA
ncbi:MAG: GNAT family protein [bacterium]|nr:GNAT family protein [bacterium]MDZ4285005.1 GNAT family protein [Patescibacteria group bacterium]